MNENMNYEPVIKEVGDTILCVEPNVDKHVTLLELTWDGVFKSRTHIPTNEVEIGSQEEFKKLSHAIIKSAGYNIEEADVCLE